MNILYLFPPQWMPISPHFALPSLMGQFEGSEYSVSAMDLNLDFYNEVLTENFVSKSLKRAIEIEPELFSEIGSFYERGKDFKTYTNYQKNRMAKHVMIKDFLQKHKSDIDKIPILVEGAVSVMRSKTHFYNPKLLLQSLNIIDTALKIVSMPYFPAIISLSSYNNQHFELNFDSIKYYVFDEDTNIYIDFYKRMLPKILDKKPDQIGISINSSSQIIAGLTLASILKKETDVHISIGGNFFARVTESLEKRPEFFELFADSLIVEEGETPVLELAEYVAGKIPIEKVSNLMYLKNGKVLSNPKVEPMKLNNMKPISLKGFELDKYFVPELIMPFQTSRGCYWRKCSFCDHDFGMHYNIKNLDSLVEQIKEMKSKYGITKFEFIDEAIGPKYMEEMSDRFIKEDLNITFFCDARLESEFSKEIMQKAYKAGLRMVLWGLESGSRRIMDLINKGVDFDKRLEVLRNSREAGIFNFAFIFFGFPAETKEDAMKTIDMVCKNSDIINVYGKSIFTMGKHTKLRETPEKYGVVGETKQEEEFSPTYTFTAKGMTKEELNEMSDLCAKKAFEVYGNGLIFQLISRELLFLYIDKYGSDWVSNYRF